MAWPLFAGLGATLTGFAGYMVSSTVARLSSLVIFSTVGLGVFDFLLGQVQNQLSGAPEKFLFIAQIAGFDQALGIIAGAVWVRVMVGMWSMRPSSAITGGS